MVTRLKKNISRNYVFSLIQNIDLTRGIWMLYWYSEAAIGALYAFTALGGALLAPQVYKIEAIMKERGILLYMPIVTTLSLLVLHFRESIFYFLFPCL